MTMPWGRALTRADLFDVPEDGHRYELVDGLLIVSPAPKVRHQDVVFGLAKLLDAGLPSDLKVVIAPCDVVLGDDTVVQPDLVVAPRRQFTDNELMGAPLLAVEVLSPSTRRIDQVLKRDRYAAAGISSYWLLDPDVPSFEALELHDGAYGVAAQARGDEVAEVSSPYSLQICPSVLVEPRG